MEFRAWMEHILLGFDFKNFALSEIKNCIERYR